MTRSEAEQLVTANRLLYPLDFCRFSENDFESLAMLYHKALGAYDFQSAKEALVECSKTCQHCIKVSDLYAKLTPLRGRDAMMMQKLKRDSE
uniref:Replisome organizer protein n=1 Tax=virus sp. ctqEG8 TaxID=2827998 RepID=A0A8S5RFA0_9VIRU|nr:MAG TPA: replisome organizer protein [virus sp. ctqEG8]